jgi:hypothetical protein
MQFVESVAINLFGSESRLMGVTRAPDSSLSSAANLNQLVAKQRIACLVTMKTVGKVT